MIERDLLEKVSTIYCHANPDSFCPDGVASALLLRDALPEANVAFVNHTQLAKLPPHRGALFCDITPGAEWLGFGAIVLDHHRTAADIVRLFEGQGLGVYADAPGVSGAPLAYEHVWLPMKFPDGEPAHRRHAIIKVFATRAGVRDTWQRHADDHESWRDACAQAAALTWWPWSKWPRDFYVHGMNREAAAMLNLGYILLDKREEETARMVECGMRLMSAVKSTRIVIVPSRDTSDVAEAYGDTADLVIGFAFDKPEGFLPRMILSTRSHTNFDCAAFCKAHGGGGHTRAAGITMSINPDDLNPYTFILDLVEGYERRTS